MSIKNEIIESFESGCPEMRIRAIGEIDIFIKIHYKNRKQFCEEERINYGSLTTMFANRGKKAIDYRNILGRIASLMEEKSGSV